MTFSKACPAVAVFVVRDPTFTAHKKRPLTWGLFVELLDQLGLSRLLVARDGLILSRTESEDQ